MLAAGLSLRPRAILAPLRDVRLVLAAIVLNFVVAPVFAVFLTLVIPLERPHAIGLLLLGGAAGAPFLPKLAEGADGDLGFAVALMTLLTIGTTFFMPFALPLIIPGLQASPWSIARPLLVFILAPLAIGMLLRSLAPVASAAFQPGLAKLGNVSAVVLITLLVVLYFNDLIGVVGSGALAVAAVFIAALGAAGYFLGGSREEIRGVLGLGTAARNVGAALVPASQSFSDPKIIVMLVASTIVMLGVLELLAVRRFMVTRNAKPNRASTLSRVMTDPSPRTLIRPGRVPWSCFLRISRQRLTDLKGTCPVSIVPVATRESE